MNKLTRGSGDASQHAAPPQYVITLMSSWTPMSLQGPSARELAGLAVFRSQRREDGRQRFRLHIGFFASAEAAEAALLFVRESYPAAFASLAPETNMGSLDDTAVAQFSVIRPIEAGPRAPATQATQAPPPPAQHISPPAPPVTVMREPVVAAAPPTPPPAPPQAVQDEPAQHYAVQLLWSAKPIDVSVIPRLEIFDGYLLYAVETRSGGRRMYGVRLGFYADALSAGLVARYVRPAFAKTVVVPVSARENARASTATISLAPPKAGRKPKSRARWPASPIAVEFVPDRPGGASATL